VCRLEGLGYEEGFEIPWSFAGKGRRCERFELLTEVTSVLPNLWQIEFTC